MIDTALGFDELSPFIGKNVRITISEAEHGGRCIQLVLEDGRPLLSFYRYNFNLKRVHVSTEFVVPEPLVDYAKARLLGEVGCDEPAVSIDDCQNKSLADVPTWAVT